MVSACENRSWSELLIGCCIDTSPLSAPCTALQCAVKIDRIHYFTLKALVGIQKQMSRQTVGFYS